MKQKKFHIVDKIHTVILVWSLNNVCFQWNIVKKKIGTILYNTKNMHIFLCIRILLTYELINMKLYLTVCKLKDLFTLYM